jgi:CRISPR-associated protein Cas1
MIQMIRRAVEITGPGRRLSKDRGFLVISQDHEELGRLPIDDLEVVLCAGHGATCTGEAMNALAERCVPLIFCDHRFMPSAILWPVESHHLQSGRIRAQAGLSLPMRKQLWRQIVRAKILAQAESLRLCAGVRNPRLIRMSEEVKSGDSSNMEGQAARLYWPLLFGADFRRDPDLPGVNALLNYGYAVLRSSVARAIMLAGLHPAFGLHHCNRNDTMPLADDLMEPFRPLADLLAFSIAKEYAVPPELDPRIKERLAGLGSMDLIRDGEASPLSETLARLTHSLAEICEGHGRTLRLPDGIRLSSEDAS